MRITFQQKLLLDVVRQGVEERKTGRRKLALPGSSSYRFVASSAAMSEDLVELRDQMLNLRNKIDQTLRNKNHAVMFPEVCSFANDVRDAVRHLPQGLVLRVNLLADDGNIGMRLQCALESDVRSSPTHQAHKMVVLPCGPRVYHDVPDELRVDLARRVEAEARGHLLRLQISIDCLRTPDHSRLQILGSEILPHERRICVGIVSADDDQPV